MKKPTTKQLRELESTVPTRAESKFAREVLAMVRAAAAKERAAIVRFIKGHGGMFGGQDQDVGATCAHLAKTIAGPEVVMTRDPFVTPFEVPITDDGSETQRVFAALAKRAPGFNAVCVARAASEPQNVVDATADGVCHDCRCACWRSPSTRRMSGAVALFCLSCVAHELRRLRGIQ